MVLFQRKVSILTHPLLKLYHHALYSELAYLVKVIAKELHSADMEVFLVIPPSRKG